MAEDEFKTPADGASATTENGRTTNNGIDPGVVSNLEDDFNRVANDADQSAPRRDPNDFEKLRLIIEETTKEAEMVVPLFGRLEDDIHTRNDNLKIQ